MIDMPYEVDTGYKLAFQLILGTNFNDTNIQIF